MNGDTGAALIDVVAATTVMIITAAMTVPVVGGTLERERALVGVRYLAQQVQRARLESLRRASAVALRVEVLEGRTALRFFVDGNGNGVQEKDISRGVDRPITALDWLDQHAAEVSLRINQAVPDIGGGGWLAPGDDPLRIGRTALLAFSPLGSSTSGTLYVARPRGPQWAIRILGATSRIRVLLFDAPAGQWQP